MKSDLDPLMRSRKLDALIVLGSAAHNPPMHYLIGGGHVSDAILVKKPGEGGVIFVNPMEREEAARSGLTVRLINEFGYDDLLKQANGDDLLAEALRLQLILKDLGLTRARIGLYGRTDFSNHFGVFAHMHKLLPEVEFVGEATHRSIFVLAMETKDADEIERIRAMGRITTEVVRQTQEFLTACPVNSAEQLLNDKGQPLTIGEMKARIRQWVIERGGDLPDGFIFAMGHDAGVPHSSGTPEDVIRLGQTIIYDIFPAEVDGGYFYDFTRTWTLGYATPEAQQLYDEVHEIYDRISDNFDLNAPFKQYEVMTCDYFESKGHATKRTSPPAPLSGYVHSLGHGVGLNIHELPVSALSSAPTNILKPGVVITSEPGLYYPEKNMGVRIEDTVWVRPDGSMEILAEYPYDFVLPMQTWTKKSAA
jgi:Xaa-Pro aminopeptidase